MKKYLKILAGCSDLIFQQALSNKDNKWSSDCLFTALVYRQSVDRKRRMFELIVRLGYNVRPAYSASVKSSRKFTHSFMLGCLKG